MRPRLYYNITVNISIVIKRNTDINCARTFARACAFRRRLEQLKHFRRVRCFKLLCRVHAESIFCFVSVFAWKQHYFWITSRPRGKVEFMFWFVLLRIRRGPGWQHKGIRHAFRWHLLCESRSTTKYVYTFRRKPLLHYISPVHEFTRICIFSLAGLLKVSTEYAPWRRDS